MCLAAGHVLAHVFMLMNFEFTGHLITCCFNHVLLRCRTSRQSVFPVTLMLRDMHDDRLFPLYRRSLSQSSQKDVFLLLTFCIMHPSPPSKPIHEPRKPASPFPFFGVFTLSHFLTFMVSGCDYRSVISSLSSVRLICGDCSLLLLQPFLSRMSVTLNDFPIARSRSGVLFRSIPDICLKIRVALTSFISRSGRLTL